MKSTTMYWIILLLVVSSIFRIFFIDLIEFKGDEAATVYEMLKFFDYPTILQTGPISSMGNYNPPFYHYLIILISVVSRDPQYISFMIALINTICIPIFYLLVKRYYSSTTALFASFLIASSPILILYSRKIWNTNLLMPFLLLYLYFTQQIFLKNDKKAYFGLALTLTLITQIHLSGLFLAGATTATILIYKKRVDFKKTILGFLIGLLTALPFFFRQISSVPFCIDCQTVLKYQIGVHLFDFNNLLRPFQLLNGIFYSNNLGLDYSVFTEKFPIIKILNIIFLAEVLIPILGSYLIFKHAKKYFFIIIISVFSPFFVLITRTPAYIYHFIVISPFIALIYALTFQKLLDLTKSKLTKKIILIVFFTIISANLITISSFYVFLKEKKSIRGDYGKIFSLTERYVLDQTQDYRSMKNFNEIKDYALVFSQYPKFHFQMGQYFAYNNSAVQAVVEFKKAIVDNPDDLGSRANLAYIYILTGQKKLAQEEISVIDKSDSKTAEDLRKIFNSH